MSAVNVKMTRIGIAGGGYNGLNGGNL